MPSDPPRPDPANDADDGDGDGPSATSLLDAWHHYQVIEQGRLPATYAAERFTMISLWDHAAILRCTDAGTHRPDRANPRRRRRCPTCPTVPPAKVTETEYRDWLDRPPAPAHGTGNAHRPDTKERSTRAIYGRRVTKMYRHWHATGLLAVNPLGKVRVPKMPRGPVRSLTRHQVATILADATRRRHIRDRSVLGLVYHGLRRAEVADLDATNLILDPGEELVRVLGKGPDGGKEREVPLHESMVPILVELLTDPATGVRRTTGPLIPNWRRPGHHLKPRTITGIVSRASAAAGEHTTPHQWRHAIATHLIDAGADLREVQGLLGHESLATTETYTQGARRRLRHTISRMPVTCAGHRVAERPPRPAPTVPPPRREPGVRCKGRVARRRRR